MHLGMMRATTEVLCREGSYPESGVMECSWVCGQFYRGVGILSLGKWELHLVGFCVCGRDKSSNYKRVAAEAFKGFLVLRPVA